MLNRRQPSRRKSNSRRLRLERLEDRRVLATITVTTPLDVVDIEASQLEALPGADGVVSLREATMVANFTFDGGGRNVVELDPAVFADSTTIVLELGEMIITNADVVGIDRSLSAIDLNQSGLIVNRASISGFEIFNGSTAIRTTSKDVLTVENVHLHSSDVAIAATELIVRDSLIENNGHAVEYVTNTTNGFGEGMPLHVSNSTIVGNERIASGTFTFNSSVTLVDSVVSENGSGLDDNFVTLLRTEYSNNDGGIFANNVLEMQDSIFSDNGSELAAVIAFISGSEITNNAGGISAYGSLSMTDTVFAGNGGGLDLMRAGLDIQRSAIVGNAAGLESWGGTIVDSTISGNQGAGVNLVEFFGSNDSKLRIERSTISGNSGGGLIHSVDSPAERFGDDTIEIVNSIVAGNGGFDTSAVGPGPEMKFVSLGHNLFGFHEGSADSLSPHSTDILLQVDPGLAVATDNGGDTLTQWVLPTSPALDAGAAGVGLTDQRGFPRFVDADEDGFAQSDIGAFESDGSQPSLYLEELSVSSPRPGEPVVLSAMGVSTDGGALTYTWEFSDGVTLSGANAMRSYTVEEFRRPRFDHDRVKLTVADASGDQISVVRAFPVDSDRPTATLVSAEISDAQYVEVVVAYRDDIAIDESTLSNDIQLLGPGGSVSLPIIDVTTQATDEGGSETIVTYRSEFEFQSGDYDVRFFGSRIRDTQSNAVTDEINAIVLTTINLDLTVIDRFVPGSGLFPNGSFSTLSHDVDLADLDNDGDLDAFLTVEGAGNQVYLNDGIGGFQPTAQSLLAGGASNENTIYSALGDLDGDGDIDALVTHGGAENEIILWQNDGHGNFSVGFKQPTSSAIDVGLADLDADGDLDAYVAQFSHPDLIFFNDGSGQMVDSGQAIGSAKSKSIEFGDLDGDGDLDAAVGVQDGPNQILKNDGAGELTFAAFIGVFTDQHVALGDLDGDGDLDAVGSSTGVYWNDGGGNFVSSVNGPLPGASNATSHVGLGDLDNDGDLDAFLANWGGDEDWIAFNDGRGFFTGELVSGSQGTISSHVALGDTDNDGDLDAVVAVYQDDLWSPSWTNTTSGFALPCDYVGGDGCDIADLNAVYDGTFGASVPLTDSLILDWLAEASSASNPLKSDPAVMYVLGDVNLDGNVDGIDLGLLLNNFGDDAGLNWGGGNLNSDQVVDSADLGSMLNNFGHQSSPAATSASVALPVALSGATRDRIPRAALPVREYLFATNDQSDVVFVAPPIRVTRSSDANRASVRDLVFGGLGDEDED